MAQLFTVIQGGLSATQSVRADAPTGRPRRSANGQITLAWSREVPTAPEILQDADLAQPAPVLIDGAAIEAVDRAIRTRLATLRPSLRLVGADAASSRPIRTVARPAGLRVIPAQNLLGVRPQGWQPPVVIAPMSHDTPAPSVPVSPRSPARVRCEGLLRRAAEFVTGALQLGSAPAALAWRRAQG